MPSVAAVDVTDSGTLATGAVAVEGVVVAEGFVFENVDVAFEGAGVLLVNDSLVGL